MSRRIVAAAVALVIVAAALVAYKVLRLGYELFPGPSPDRFSVETEVKLEGAERGRASFFLPGDGPGQRIYDEHVSAGGMQFFIRPQGGNRIGEVVGRPDADATVRYRFSMQVRPLAPEELPGSAPALDDAGAAAFAALLGPEAAIQTDAAVVARLVAELGGASAGPAMATKRIHDFVVRDVALTDGHDGPQDAAAVLERERGGPLGKARAEVALLRAADVPARVMIGVPVAEGRDREPSYWVEARLGDRFYPLDPISGAAGTLPAPRLVLHAGDAPLPASGLDAVSYRVSMLREPQNQYRIYQRRRAAEVGILDRLSLYGLPPATQALYRVLMLVPLGALVVVVFRNLIGLATFGTFMPILLSLAFRESGLGMGLLLLSVVVAAGYLGRYILDRARLLMVPRLAFLLTLVILIMAGIMLGAQALGVERAFSIALFPIVIITMMIERLSVAIVEEGPRNAAKLVVGTVVVAACGWAVIASERLQHFVFTFPEIHLVTLALLLLLGRYTGYRLLEWARFRALHEEGR